MTRRPARGAVDEQGMSLVEVLISMIVMSMLGLAVVSTVASVAGNAGAATGRITATNRAQSVLDRVSKSLRAAHLSSDAPLTAVTLADTNHLTFLADVGDSTGPRRVDLSVSGPTAAGSLTEVFTRADTGGTTYTGTAVSRLLAPADVNTSAGGVFTYYDSKGVVLAAPMSTAAQTSLIARVRVTLTLREAGGSPVTATALVLLRNVEYQ